MNKNEELARKLASQAPLSIKLVAGDRSETVHMRAPSSDSSSAQLADGLARLSPMSPGELVARTLDGPASISVPLIPGATSIREGRYESETSTGGVHVSFYIKALVRSALNVGGRMWVRTPRNGYAELFIEEIDAPAIGAPSEYANGQPTASRTPAHATPSGLITEFCPEEMPF